MAARRLPLRKTRQILRLLWHLRLGVRATARSSQISHTTVLQYRDRAEEAGLSWEEVEPMDEASLERLLFPSTTAAVLRPLPDWSKIQAELRRPGVTLQLLWDEYKGRYSEDGYQYSRFCELYREWRGRLDLSMRQEHRAGEKLFVDYSGQTVPVVDPSTGEERQVQIFVAVLGASSYTYAEATLSQQLPDWIASHVRAFEFFGGVPELLIPDNLKSGVTTPCRYEPDLNRTYEDLATHYDTVVIPARVRKPKDKAKVEAGVQLVQRWILACLRHRRFFSLSELNAAIRELLERLNEREFRKLPGSRRSQFEALDRPALKPLPAMPFEYCEWSRERVRSDYHVEVEGHFYSVPYQLAGREVEVRLTAQGVEFLHRGKRVACHVRSRERGASTTLVEHMPREHRHYAEWTPQRLVHWAGETGAATAQVVEEILISRRHPHQGFHSCLGLHSLAKRYGPERLEAACHRALDIQGLSYRSIRSILRSGLDRQAVAEPVAEPAPVVHGNVRGAAYYSSRSREVVPC